MIKKLPLLSNVRKTCHLILVFSSKSFLSRICHSRLRIFEYSEYSNMKHRKPRLDSTTWYLHRNGTFSCILRNNHVICPYSIIIKQLAKWIFTKAWTIMYIQTIKKSYRMLYIAGWSAFWYCPLSMFFFGWHVSKFLEWTIWSNSFATQVTRPEYTGLFPPGIFYRCSVLDPWV